MCKTINSSNKCKTLPQITPFLIAVVSTQTGFSKKQIILVYTLYILQGKISPLIQIPATVKFKGNSSNNYAINYNRDNH